jgi:hypothetical protein
LLIRSLILNAKKPPTRAGGFFVPGRVLIPVGRSIQLINEKAVDNFWFIMLYRRTLFDLTAFHVVHFKKGGNLNSGPEPVPEPEADRLRIDIPPGSPATGTEGYSPVLATLCCSRFCAFRLSGGHFSF